MDGSIGKSRGEVLIAMSFFEEREDAKDLEVTSLWKCRFPSTFSLIEFFERFFEVREVSSFSIETLNYIIWFEE